MQAHMTTLTNTQPLKRRHVEPVSQAENKLSPAMSWKLGRMIKLIV